MGETSEEKYKPAVDDLPQELVRLVELFRQEQIESRKDVRFRSDTHDRETDLIATSEPKDLLPEFLNNFHIWLRADYHLQMAEQAKDPKEKQRILMRTGALNKAIEQLPDKEKALIKRIGIGDTMMPPAERYRALGRLFVKMVESGFTARELRQ